MDWFVINDTELRQFHMAGLVAGGGDSVLPVVNEICGRKISYNSDVQKPAHNTDYMAALVKIKKIIHGRGDTVTKVGKVSDLIASLNFPKAENCT